MIPQAFIAQSHQIRVFIKNKSLKWSMTFLLLILFQNFILLVE